MAKLQRKPATNRRLRHFVKEWRKFRGYSQERLAEITGVTHGAISQLETGRIGYTQAMLEVLAEALMCEPGDLVMRRPGDDAIWSIWEQAKSNERETITELAKTIVRRRAE